jgi:hypothetical protein
MGGVADYILGYPAQEDASKLLVELTFIIFEAKKGATFSKGRAQVAAYLGTYVIVKIIDDSCLFWRLTIHKTGIQQQRRLAKKTIFSHGWRRVWVFKAWP